MLAAAPSIAGQADPISANAKHSHSAPGTSIIRFGEIDQDVYKGSKPKNAADYRFLK